MKLCLGLWAAGWGDLEGGGGCRRGVYSMEDGSRVRRGRGLCGVRGPRGVFILFKQQLKNVS